MSKYVITKNGDPVTFEVFESMAEAFQHLETMTTKAELFVAMKKRGDSMDRNPEAFLEEIKTFKVEPLRRRAE